jgi:antitoxin YxxD
MANYNGFIKFILPKNSETNKTLKHNFFPVSKTDIIEAESRLDFLFPDELDEFYAKIGYGFMNCQELNTQHLLFSPNQIAAINNREDFYEFDPDLEVYDNLNRFIFFRLNEGVYLTMDKNKIEGRFNIYYFDKKIAESLEEFLTKFDENSNYFED